MSPFRAALLELGLGEWAFKADGQHVRVARIERAQLLFESDGRGALHRLLRALLPGLDELARGAIQHWGIEIDPQEI